MIYDLDPDEDRQVAALVRIFADADGAQQLRAMADRHGSRIHIAALARVERELEAVPERIEEVRR